MRKFLFLDIDGVMNNSEMWNLPIEQQISEDKIKLLKNIIDATDCEIVLSSTWRIIDRHKHIVGRNLTKYDIDLMYETPLLNEGNRGDEIKLFLKPFAKNNVPFKFVILDDDKDMNEYTDTNLVKIDCNTGLTESDVEKAISILND